jgi:3-oxoacyl-[acyl-carrier protein] reductase
MDIMSLENGQLAGRAALVTGGSRGIGAAIALTLAKCGADVAVTYARSAELTRQVVDGIHAAGRRGLALEADSRDANAVERAVNDTVAAFGRLDVLVCNAGIFRAAPLDELTLEDFDETMSVNLRAPFVAVKAAAARMGEDGRIVLIGSNLAEHVGAPGMAAYAASKAALVALAKGLARDLGPRRITVNVVQPGSTDTDMNPAAGPHAEAQRLASAIGRFAEPGEIAELVAWLASPRAGFVTGAAFTSDGGTNA